MNGKKVPILVGLISFAVLILGIVIVSKSQPPVLEQIDTVSIEIVDGNSHDFGEIDIEGGNAEKTFEIKNTGESDLKVTNFKTSCMCTQVKVSINGKDSPIFGMHARSGWKGIIKPGGTADIKVLFDPMFHGPQGVGPVTRMISFNTNDSNNPIIELTLSGNVINK